MQKRFQSVAALVGILSLVTMWYPVLPAKAANLTAARLYMNRQQANIASGVEFDLFIKPATSLTGSTNTITIKFPNDANSLTKWCRTAGTLTLTAEGEPANTTQVTAEGATNIIGTVTGACAQSTPDTFTISAVGALQNTTEYGVHIAANGAAIGTATAATNNMKVIVATQQGGGADTDTYTIAVATVTADRYAVSGTIDPTLTVGLSATTLNLGTLDATHINYQGVTSTISTNAKSGYVSVVKYSGIMTNATSDTIADAGGTVTAGTSGFGASTDKSTQTIGTSTASPTCSTTMQSVLTGPYVATSLTTGFKQFASAATAASGDATVLCFLASVSGTQALGAYSTTVTLVTTAKF